MFAGFTVFYMKTLIFTKPKSGGSGVRSGVGVGVDVNQESKSF